MSGGAKPFGAAWSDLRDLLGTGEDLVLEAWRRSDAQDEPRLDPESDARTALDRIAQIGCVGLDHSHVDLVRLVVESFVRLYHAAVDESQVPLARLDASHVVQARRCRDIVDRIYVLGALAVIRKEFSIIPAFVWQQPNGRRTGHNWLRETVTALARGGVFQPKSVIPPIADLVADREVFFKRFSRSKDRLVNVLCQFDFLQCIVVIAATGDWHNCYPNFGVYYNERTEPIVEALLPNGLARVALPNVSDDEVAKAILQVDDLAAQLYFDYAGWHRRSWTSPKVETFLATHAPV